jgi:hypothetical protein
VRIDRGVKRSKMMIAPIDAYDGYKFSADRMNAHWQPGGTSLGMHLIGMVKAWCDQS